MKRGLIAVLALLIVFAMTSCDTGSSPSDNITITFNLGEAPGTPPPSVTIGKGTPITAAQIPPKPVWAEHTFKGWYNGTTKLVAGLYWQTNVVFTAEWVEGELTLDPWAPAEQPTEPTDGYKNFYEGVAFEDWQYSTFAGSGNVGSIEDNGDGTYLISIPTVPGGRSIVSFNSSEYMFRNGYYLLFNFPEDTEAKPIAAVTLAATGSANEEGFTWGTEYNVNTVTEWVPTLEDVYLAGDIAFARDDLESLDTLFKSVLIELVWSADEEAEYYEFTLKKLLITTGEDLTPIDPNTLEPETPAPKTEPEDYVVFPQNEALRATFFPWNEGNKLEGNTVTVVAPASGRTLVRLLGTDYKWANGYYLSVTLPNNSNKPQKIYSLGTDGDESNGAWGVADLVQASSGKFLAGRVDFAWAPDSGTSDGYTGLMLDIYWYPDQTQTMYTFTIDKILVAGEYDPSAVPDPDDLTGWTPPAKTEPIGWEPFPSASGSLAATYYPWNAGNTITGNTVTVVAPATGRTLVRLTGDFNYQKGYYLSVILPDNANKPTSITALATTSSTSDGDWNATETITAPSGSFIKGKADFTWSNDDSTDLYAGVVLDITWAAEQTQAMYTFTVNKIFVVEEVAANPWDDFVDFYTASAPITGTVAANWNNTYNQAYTVFTNADSKLFTGGYYVSVTLSDANLVTPEEAMIIAYDADGNVKDDWVSNKIVTVSSGTVEIFWDGNTWGGTPSTTEHAKMEFYLRWDATTGGSHDELNKTLTFTVNAVKVGALVP